MRPKSREHHRGLATVKPIGFACAEVAIAIYTVIVEETGTGIVVIVERQEAKVTSGDVCISWGEGSEDLSETLIFDGLSEYIHVAVYTTISVVPEKGKIIF